MMNADTCRELNHDLIQRSVAHMRQDSVYVAPMRLDARCRMTKRNGYWEKVFCPKHQWEKTTCDVCATGYDHSKYHNKVHYRCNRNQ